MTAAEQLVRDTAEFNRCARELGLGDLSGYYWYHTIDLPHDLATPGLYDFRATYPCFGFPERMEGLRVLDVGSATGFFAFEFARRGAQVVSVELPSLEALDRFPGQDIRNSIDEIQRMMFPESVDASRVFIRRYSPEELYFYLLEGPFEFCRKLLGLDIARCYASVYDLPARRMGEFDLVFLGDILLHTINPLAALAAVAPLCRGKLVLAQVMPEVGGAEPAMLYVGGAEPARDEVQWWWPNQACLIQLLKKLGFREVVEHGHHTGVLRPSGYVFDRTVLHAVR
jgi:tRNA (mo5U34)-methyltransferase